jgi:hypothetical protein
LAAPLARYQLAPEVALRRERVVGSAAQRDVVDGRGAAERPGVFVVVLEQRGLAAGLAAFIDVAAAALIALPDGAGDRR